MWASTGSATAAPASTALAGLGALAEHSSRIGEVDALLCRFAVA